MHIDHIDKLKTISFKQRLKRRHNIEIMFKLLGLLAIVFSGLMLIILLYSVSMKGYSAFYTYYLKTNLYWDKETLINKTESYNLQKNKYENLLVNSINKELQPFNIKMNKSTILKIISNQEIMKLKSIKKNNNSIIAKKIVSLHLSSDVEMYLKGKIDESYFSKEDITLINLLKKQNLIEKKFNFIFFSNADSSYPEKAGIKGAFFGSVYTIGLSLIFSVVLGVGAAIYLEEFAHKNFLTKLIEININNLAAVPSIIFGLLGLIIFEQLFKIPRSTPLLASLVLTLMALPTIIITTRVAISSIPRGIREAAYGMGSSKIQLITRHLLPIATPSILTGIIMAMLRILGETAPLLMIGMVAFINNVPESITDTALVFPIQILLWSNIPEVGYVEKASAAIMLLMSFLIFISGISIYLRNKFEVKF